jgi:hypothetical protein
MGSVVAEPKKRLDSLPELLGSIERLSLIVLGCIVLYIVIYACAQAGGFLGFLFGIPRLLRRASEAASDEARSPKGTTDARQTEARQLLSTNTNLEEISDWLTKIIVGLSIFEAVKIPPLVGNAADKFKGALPGVTGADVSFVLVLISASVLGFLYVYTETRTRVTVLFTKIEERADQSLSEAHLTKTEEGVDQSLSEVHRTGPTGSTSATGPGGVTSATGPTGATGAGVN